MKAANITAGVAVALWSLLTLIGISGLSGVAAQNVAGYPNMGQIKLYAIWPMFVVIGVLLCAWVCNATRRGPWVLTTTSAVSLGAILPYLAVWGGGV